MNYIDVLLVLYVPQEYDGSLTEVLIIRLLEGYEFEEGGSVWHC